MTYTPSPDPPEEYSPPEAPESTKPISTSPGESRHSNSDVIVPGREPRRVAPRKVDEDTSFHARHASGDTNGSMFVTNDRTIQDSDNEAHSHTRRARAREGTREPHINSDTDDDQPLAKLRPIRAAHDGHPRPLDDSRKEPVPKAAQAPAQAPAQEAMRTYKKPGPRPWAAKPIAKNDLVAKKALIQEIQGYWGKDFIKAFIPKCHRPLVKRVKGPKKSCFRNHETNPMKWLPSVLKAVLMIAKKTSDKAWLRKAMADIVKYRIKHTGNRKPQLVTTDFDVLDDLLVKGWDVATSFGIRYKHLLQNRPTKEVESDADIEHILYAGSVRSDSDNEDDMMGNEDDDMEEDMPENSFDDARGSEISNQYPQPNGYRQSPPYRQPLQKNDQTQAKKHQQSPARMYEYGHGPPIHGYSHPMHGYGYSMNGYGPPPYGYGPPDGRYGASNDRYGPPAGPYGPPTDRYNPPSTSYGPPMHRRDHNSHEYHGNRPSRAGMDAAHTEDPTTPKSSFVGSDDRARASFPPNSNQHGHVRFSPFGRNKRERQHASRAPSTSRAYADMGTPESQPIPVPANYPKIKREPSLDDENGLGNHPHGPTNYRDPIDEDMADEEDAEMLHAQFVAAEAEAKRAALKYRLMQQKKSNRGATSRNPMQID